MHILYIRISNVIHSITANFETNAFQITATIKTATKRHRAPIADVTAGDDVWSGCDKGINAAADDDTYSCQQKKKLFFNTFTISQKP